MAPIPARKPKGANPLPLKSTLADLSSLHAQNIDLSVLLDRPANQSASAEHDEALKRSDDFIKNTRRALGVGADVTAQGDRIEAIRATLQEVEAGFS